MSTYFVGLIIIFILIVVVVLVFYGLFLFKKFEVKEVHFTPLDIKHVFYKWQLEQSPPALDLERYVETPGSIPKIIHRIAIPNRANAGSRFITTAPEYITREKMP